MGAIYRDHDPGRDSSLEDIIGPGDIATARTAQQPPANILSAFELPGNSLYALGKALNGDSGLFERFPIGSVDR